jgi:HEAT repeat protein
VGLGDLQAGEALSALLVAIEDIDPRVRQVAINALGEIGDGRAVPRLVRALSDARPEVRYQAIIAYVKLAADASDVTAAIARALADEDDAVRYIALRVTEERLDAGRAVDPSLASIARERLKDGSSHVALAAAILLAKLGDDTARDVVLRVVREGRAFGSVPEKEDEREAVEIAGQLGLREAIPDLERRAWGLRSMVRDTCAWHAKIALARLGHARARAEILRDLASPREDTRGAAVVAAGRARLVEAKGALERLRGGGDPLVDEALARLQA